MTTLTELERKNFNQRELICRLRAINAELLAALKELSDLAEDHLAGNYKPDSFTTQPARAAIAKAESNQ